MISRPGFRLNQDDFDDARQDDQYAVDTGQLSPREFKETWGDLPAIHSEDIHRMWCGKRDHSYLHCPVWGDE